MTSVAGEMNLLTAVGVLDNFLRAAPLTDSIAALEKALNGADKAGAVQATALAGITVDLLAAVVTVRARLGRISDLLHAAGIALTLPALLEEGELITVPPSLAAGNDPARPYDLQTDRRAVEFKFSQWKGADTVRKRQTFKDFVLLAASDAPRTELLVVGPEPEHFLRTCRSTAAWGLNRTPGALAVFESKFGSSEVTIAEFTAAHVGVAITDVCTLLPADVASLLSRAG